MNDNSYTNWTSMSDKALIKTIGTFIQHHRLNQNKSQSDIAKAANIIDLASDLVQNVANCMVCVEDAVGWESGMGSHLASDLA